MSDRQFRWQEIAFLMLAGWMGWLSLMVFSQQNSIRILEMQVALINGKNIQEVQREFERLKSK